jgi:hypothetical protein
MTGHNQGNGGKRKQTDGGSDFVANTNAQHKNQRRKGKLQFGGPKFNLEAMLNDPFPKHSLPGQPSTLAWKDCFIMKEYKISSFNQNHGGNNGPPGGSGSGSQGPGFGGSSNSGYQGQSNHGGYNQQSGQGNQQHQSGYQSNPKQLNGG